MLGYCAMGRLVMASAPANMMMMAMTQAKTGRSMKNLDIGKVPFEWLRFSGRSPPWLPRRRLARRRGFHRSAGPHLSADC